MKKLYEFRWDCGRMGELQGLFIADDVDIKNLMGENIYFGEVLGKHSEIEGPIEVGDITVKSDDPEFITKLIEIMGDGTISGFNPFDFREE